MHDDYSAPNSKVMEQFNTLNQTNGLITFGTYNEFGHLVKTHCYTRTVRAE